MFAGSRGKGRGELPPSWIAAPAIVDRAILELGAGKQGHLALALFRLRFGRHGLCRCAYVSMGNGQVDARRHLGGDERSMPVVFVLLESAKRLVYVSPQDRHDLSDCHALNNNNVIACKPASTLRGTRTQRISDTMRGRMHDDLRHHVNIQGECKGYIVI